MTDAGAQEALDNILKSAAELGVEMNEAEALEWLTTMAAQQGEADDVEVQVSTGVYGHRVAMMDFSPAELDRFRAIGEIVGLDDRPGQVETALALSGSAAQSKIQTYPGDCDYFERVHIHAPTRDDACRILAEVMHEKVLATASGPTQRFMQARLGSYPTDVVRGEETISAGSSITWTLDEVRDAKIAGTLPGGAPWELSWNEAAAEPGWCKLDWVVADPIRGTLANASNMLDATWEAPDGTITPLDEYLDTYFQEVYLDADSLPLFAKLARHVLPDAVDDYAEQLERQIYEYTVEKPNYGKAAKRMYNLFRLTGRYEEAAYLRELFDEKATALYQVAALIRSLDEAAGTGSEISRETLRSQTDALIVGATEALAGDEQGSSILQHLQAVKEVLDGGGDPASRADVIDSAIHAVSDEVNEYFKARMVGLPEIRIYLESLEA
ncbi:MAG: hypothetical protein ACHQCI_01845 [Solirubrobacterales bacterium]